MFELKNRTLILATLSIFFIIIYSSFYLLHHDTFNSPDETANHYFALRLADGLSLSAPAAMLGEEGSAITPRSMRVVNGELVPASFMGTILIYGIAAFIFGSYTLYFLPTLAAIAGVWGFYFLIRYIWWEQLAFFASLLLFFLPSWWYYATFGFFPNVLFVTLVLWSLVFILRFSETGNYRWLVPSALFITAALITRLSALPWIFVVYTVISFYYFKKNSAVKPFALFTLTLTLPLGALFILQQDLYGSALETGYVFASQDAGRGFFTALFPHGVNVFFALEQWSKFFLILFWYISVPAFFGIAVFIKRYHKVSTLQKLYALLYGIVVLWLSVYYGSLIVTDNITDEVTLGASYVRYWIPMTVGALPFVVYGVHVLYNSLRLSKRLRNTISAFFLIAYVTLSTQVTYFTFNDSILNVRNTLADNALKKEFVLRSTEEDAVLITYRQDKIFFPDRHVIHTLDDESIFDALPHIYSERPLYFYTFLPPDTVAERIAPLLAQRELTLTAYGTIMGDTLYKIGFQEEL